MSFCSCDFRWIVSFRIASEMRCVPKPGPFRSRRKEETHAGHSSLLGRFVHETVIIVIDNLQIQSSSHEPPQQPHVSSHCRPHRRVAPVVIARMEVDACRVGVEKPRCSCSLALHDAEMQRSRTIVRLCIGISTTLVDEKYQHVDVAIARGVMHGCAPRARLLAVHRKAEAVHEMLANLQMTPPSPPVQRVRPVPIACLAHLHLRKGYERGKMAVAREGERRREHLLRRGVGSGAPPPRTPKEVGSDSASRTEHESRG
mmetsp:Transcript_9995/g.32779  ORF Transcript_9995/g.32779 Transcript_9995/m.32779 type:complete len:258 (+) Transcript_9995:936-1709(+)